MVCSFCRHMDKMELLAVSDNNQSQWVECYGRYTNIHTPFLLAILSVCYIFMSTYLPLFCRYMDLKFFEWSENLNCVLSDVSPENVCLYFINVWFFYFHLFWSGYFSLREGDALLKGCWKEWQFCVRKSSLFAGSSSYWNNRDTICRCRIVRGSPNQWKHGLIHYAAVKWGITKIRKHGSKLLAAGSADGVKKCVLFPIYLIVYRLCLLVYLGAYPCGMCKGCYFI